MKRICDSFSKLTGLREIAAFLHHAPIQCTCKSEEHYFGSKSNAMYCEDETLQLFTKARDPNLAYVQVTFCPKAKTLKIKDLVGWGIAVIVSNISKVDLVEWSYKDEAKSFRYVEIKYEKGRIILGAQLLVFIGEAEESN